MNLRFLTFPAATLLLLALAVPVFSQPDTAATESPEVAPAPVTPYRKSAEKRMKYNRCINQHRGECYERYQEAVQWCRDNWDTCFPLIKSASVSAGTYGNQVLEECRRQLDARCRAEAGD